MTELIRRDISGIYIFDTFPTDKKRKPTCIEDCQQDTRRKWCMKQNKECLRNTIKQLADTFNELTDYLHKNKCVTDNMRDEMHSHANDLVTRSKWNWAEHELADQIDSLCKMIVLLADHCGVTKHNEEEDEE